MKALRREAVLVFALLVLLFGLRCLPEVLGLRAFIAEDFPVLNLPVRAWLGQWLHRGVVPYWTELLQGGYPLYAESQAGATYPLRLLHALPIAPWTVLAWTVVLHLAWAGTGLYLYLRAQGLRSRAAFLAGLAFAASTTLLARHQHTNVLEAVSWWPWLLLAADHAVRSNRAAAWLALGAATGLMAMCGHAQFVVYGATLGALEVWREAAGLPRRERWSRLPGAALASAVAAGLAAPQYLPLLELRAHSLRAAGVWEVGDQTLKLQHLPLLAAPGFWGPLFDARYARPAQRWEVMAYLGILPLLLAGIAVRGRQPPVRFWLVLGLLALLGAVGDRLPVYRVFDILPGWAAFRAPARLTTIYALCLAILAGYGAERVASGDWRWSSRWWWLTWTTVVALALAVIAVPVVVRELDPVAAAAALFATAGCGMFALLSLGWLHLVGARDVDSPWLRSVRRALDWRRSPLLAAIGLLGIDLAWAGLALTPTVAASFYRDRPPTPEGRIAVGPGRDPKLFWYQPDTNLLLGAANLHNMSPLALANQVRLLEAGLAKGTLGELYRRLGVAWLPAARGPEALVRHGDGPSGPEAWPVYSWRSGTVAEAIEAVAAEPRGRSGELFVTGCAPRRGGPGGGPPVPYDRLTPNRVVWLDDWERIPPAGWRIDQTPYPGWRAYLGEEPAMVCQAEVVNTLVVADGERARPAWIRLVFAPVSVRCGLFLGLLTLAGGAMVICASGSARDE